MNPTLHSHPQALPRRVAVLGAAGGLGQGILRACRQAGVEVTAIVRSRPERVGPLHAGSRVVVVPSLADVDALARAFRGADAVLTALGVTPSSQDPSALLSSHMDAVEEAMWGAGATRIVLANTLLSSLPGQPPSRAMRFFRSWPGIIGRGAREQQAVVDALGNGAFSALRWTLVRAGLNARGAEEAPVASAGWDGAENSWWPVSCHAMGRWMLQEAALCRFVQAAPLVSRRRRAVAALSEPWPR